MFYRLFRPFVYICVRQMNDDRLKKGKTMTVNSLIQFMWDFPVMLFNIISERIAKLVADRNDDDARWLNG